MAASTSSSPARAARILTRKGIFIDDFWTVLDSAEEARADQPALLLPLADYLAQPQPTDARRMARTDRQRRDARSASGDAAADRGALSFVR